MQNQTIPGGPPVTSATLLQPPNVGSALVNLFLCARARHGALHKSWIKVSVALGSRLPASLLMPSVQRDGDIDMVLRSVEDEIASGASNLQDPIQSPLHYLNHLSSYWISSVYETLRLLRDRKQLEVSDRVADLFHAIELVRITIDKHEIAGDGKLKAPLQMTRLPSKDDPTDAYVYARNDNSRAYIMPTGLSARGSVVWQPVDLKANAQRIVERRWVSEQIIELWGPEARVSGERPR
jgi:hypothetical protein